jgi:hypothetical protein
MLNSVVASTFAFVRHGLEPCAEKPRISLANHSLLPRVVRCLATSLQLAANFATDLRRQSLVLTL